MVSFRATVYRSCKLAIFRGDLMVFRDGAAGARVPRRRRERAPPRLKAARRVPCECAVSPRTRWASGAAGNEELRGRCESPDATASCSFASLPRKLQSGHRSGCDTHFKRVRPSARPPLLSSARAPARRALDAGVPTGLLESATATRWTGASRASGVLGGER
jgi:hypothetical protein